MATDRIITHKMVAEKMASKKPALQIVEKSSKRGPKPKLAAQENTSEKSETNVKKGKRGRKPKALNTASKNIEQTNPTAGKRGPKPKITAALATTTTNKANQSNGEKVTKQRGRPTKAQAAAALEAKKSTKQKTVAASAPIQKKRGPKPKSKDPITTKPATEPAIDTVVTTEALPEAVVTLTITGTIEAIQSALKKLQA